MRGISSCISGQVAVDLDGHVIGDDNRGADGGDAAATAPGSLASAGCSLADVFKVNIYLTDLARLGAVQRRLCGS